MKNPKAESPNENQNKKNRKKGSGTLYQRKRGGVWHARWMVNGKLFSRSTGTANYREAEAKLAEFVAPFASKDEGETFQALQAKIDGSKAKARLAVTFAQAWEAFSGNEIDRKKGSERDEALYRGRWNRFCEWMKGAHPELTSPAQVDEFIAKEFLAEIKRNSAPKTFNLYRALLSQVWGILEKREMVAGNVWKSVKPLPVRGDIRPERKLTEEEIAALDKHLREKASPEMRLFFLLGLYTGQRSNDCALLKWDAIDFKENRIRCVPHKTRDFGTKVEIPIHATLAEALLEVPPEKRTGYVVPSIADAFLTRQSTVSRWIAEEFEAAGIKTFSEEERNGRRVKEVGFHSFRHTFISICALAGVPFSIVQAIVGHTNQRMTEEYAQVEGAALNRVLGALPALGGDSSRRMQEAALEGFQTALNGLLAAGLNAEEWERARGMLAAIGKAPVLLSSSNGELNK